MIWGYKKNMDQKQRRLILAVKRVIEERFDFSEWDSLAFLTNGEDIVRNHLSIDWVDVLDPTAYHAATRAVIISLIEKDPANLEIISEYLDLPAWLKEHDPKEYAKLYGHTQLLLDDLKDRGVNTSFEINQYILRIRDAVEADPELAIGSMKDLLESVMKCILDAHGESISNKEDLQGLLKRTQKILTLDPSELDESKKGSDIIKCTLSNLGQAVIGIAKLRNLYGTGHGRLRPSGITPRHARLVVNAGATLAVFLIETFEYHKEGSWGNPTPENSENILTA